MSGNWDTYLRQIDGRPASILVDLELAKGAPHTAFPYLAHIRVSLHHPDERGLPRQEEYERLGALEDHLDRVLAAGDQAVYVGRSASAGRFDFFFYLRRDENWESRAGNAMASFPEYVWETGLHTDPAWENYIGFLFPDVYAMNDIQNRRALRELEEQGDAPELSREIEHWAVFPDEDQARSFVGVLRDSGFAVLSGTGLHERDNEAARPKAAESGAPLATHDSGKAAEPGGHAMPGNDCFVHFSRPDAPEDINALTSLLVELAGAYGGRYQGWTCAVVARNAL